jgi:hypothetical protein
MALFLRRDGFSCEDGCQFTGRAPVDYPLIPSGAVANERT